MVGDVAAKQLVVQHCRDLLPWLLGIDLRCICPQIQILIEHIVDSSAGLEQPTLLIRYRWELADTTLFDIDCSERFLLKSRLSDFIFCGSESSKLRRITVGRLCLS